MTDSSIAKVNDVNRLRVGLTITSVGYLFVSISPVIVAGAELHGLVMAFWRSWIGFAVLALVAGATRKLSWALFVPTAPAGVCFGLSIGLFFWASQLTSIATISLLIVLQPIPLMISAHFMFAERLRPSDLGWSALAIAGAIFMVLISGSSGASSTNGDLLAAVSVLIGAGYFIFAKRCLLTMSVLPFMVGMFFWAGISLTPMVLIAGERIPAATSGDWVRVFTVALLPGVGHVLLNFSHGKTPLNMMGLLQLVIPVSGSLLAFVFLDQTLSALQIVGMVVVMAALGAGSATRILDRDTG